MQVIHSSIPVRITKTQFPYNRTTHLASKKQEINGDYSTNIHKISTICSQLHVSHFFTAYRTVAPVSDALAPNVLKFSDRTN